MRKILGIAALAVLLSGCSVQLRTAPAPVEVCDDAVTTGRLVTSAQSGLALSNQTGHVTEVLWPFGYSARQGVRGIELLDEKGTVVAREGEFVEIAGGLGPNDAWSACAGSITEVPVQG